MPDQSLFQLFTQSNALIAIGLILHKDLIDLGHLDTPLDLLDLNVSLIKLLALLANGSLVTVDKLLGLCMGLVRHVWRVRGREHHLLSIHAAAEG